MKKIKLLSVIVSLNLVLCYAGTTGKVSGSIKTVENKEPVIGADIIILGTDFGGSSDTDGNYVINNVPPGIYSVKAQFIGYKSVTVENVQVSSDMTSRVKFSLEESVVEGEEVIVTADRPLIRMDATSKLKIVTSEEMEAMPIEDFSGILGVQSGFVKDASGQLQVLGGRGNELSFMID